MTRIGRRALAILVGLAVFALYAGAAAASYAGLIALWRSPESRWVAAAALVAFTLTVGLLSYRFARVELLNGLDAVELERRRTPWLHERLDRLCAEMAVAPPDVYVARMEAPNALALGGGRSGALVIDSRLFELLDADAFEAIVAHELAHLESGDGLVQTMAYAAVRTLAGVVVLALLPALLLLVGVARSVAWISGRPAEWTDQPLMDVYRAVGDAVGLAVIGVTLLVRAHSRRREYAADDRAVEVTGDPLALARALRTIQQLSEPRRLLLRPLYVQSDADPLTRLLATHPPMDERIARLVERARERRPAARKISID